jgi:hypothetical protein
MQRVPTNPARSGRKQRQSGSPCAVVSLAPFTFFSPECGRKSSAADLMTETKSKTRKGANCTLSFVKPGGRDYSEWMLDLDTAIAASLKDSLMVG